MPAYNFMLSEFRGSIYILFRSLTGEEKNKLFSLHDGIALF